MYPNLNVTHFAGGIKIWGFLPIQWAMLAEVQLVAWPLPARAAPAQWWMAGPRKFLFKSNWKQHKSFFSDLLHPSISPSPYQCRKCWAYLWMNHKQMKINYVFCLLQRLYLPSVMYKLYTIKSINWTNRVRALNQFLFCLPNPFNVSSREDLSVAD